MTGPGNGASHLGPAGEPEAGGQPALGTGALEHRIARILSAGSLACVALLLAGTGILLARGGDPLQAGWPPFDPDTAGADLIALRPAGLLYLGLAIAIATPLARVATGLVAFSRSGERGMMLVTASVLVVIAVAIVVAGPWSG